MFTKMEQAERWVIRLEGEAATMLEQGDYEKANEYEEAADDLKRVISKVRFKCADADDWKTFNAAVASRELRDVMIASK